MKYRAFGRTGLRVSEAVLGAMTFGEQDGVGAPLDECGRILAAYLDAGGNMIDTAINYRAGLSEEYVGQLVEGRRDRLVLSTKYTVTRDATDPNGGGNGRRNLRLSLETSLRRLRTDRIDVYWVHLWDRHTPIEETVFALEDAVRAGKIVHFGISDAPAWVIAKANTWAAGHGIGGFAALQVPYNVAQRDIERELLPMADHFGLAVTTWSPLAGGLLSGKYTNPASSSAPRRLADDSLSERDQRIARAVHRVADDLGASPSQVAIAWTRVRSPSVFPIIGARTREQLTDNLGAFDLTLSEAAVRSLDEAGEFDVGFPATFIGSTSQWVFGAGHIGAREV